MKTILQENTDLKAELVAKQTAIDELTKIIEAAKNTPATPVAETPEYKQLLADNDAKVATINELTKQLEAEKAKTVEFEKAVDEAAGKKALEITAKQGLPVPVTTSATDNDTIVGSNGITWKRTK